MWLRRALAAIALLLATALVYRLGAVWVVRLFHPFDLEWMEGGMLAHAWRLAEGKPLYTEPSGEWIPYIYPAGYPQLLAWLSPVLGLGYAQARAVSLLGTLAAAAAIPWLTWRHHGRVVPGLLGAALFLGTYDEVGAFFDLVRTDGLSVGLVAWAVALGLEEDPRRRDLAGLLLFGAFAVKQNFALLGIPMALGIWARADWRMALRFALVSAVPALVWTGWHEWASEGRYLRYIVETPATHGMKAPRGFPGMPRELVIALPGAVGMLGLWAAERARHLDRWRLAAVGLAGIAAAVAHHLQPPGRYSASKIAALDLGWTALGLAIGVSLAIVFTRRRPRWRWVYGAGIGGIALLSAGLMRAHIGGFVNVLIPLYWTCAAGAAWVAAGWEERHGTWLGAVPSLLFAGHLAYDYQRMDFDDYLPRPGSVEAGEAVVDALREVEGPVFAPFSPWMVAQAGGEPGVHLIAIWDVGKSTSPFPGAEAAVERAIAEQRFAAVLDGNRGLKMGVDDAYLGARPIAPGAALRPVTGFAAYPTRLRFPKPRPSASPERPSAPVLPGLDSRRP